MCLQTSLSSSLMITLITRIFDFFMYRLNMCFQTSQCSRLVNHTDYKNTFLFREQNEYDALDYRSLLLDNHIDCKNIGFFHVQTEYESKDFPEQKLDGHIDCKNICLDSAGQHSVQGQAEAREHLPGQGCPVLFVTLSSFILAGK